MSGGGTDLPAQAQVIPLGAQKQTAAAKQTSPFTFTGGMPNSFTGGTPGTFTFGGGVNSGGFTTGQSDFNIFGTGPGFTFLDPGTLSTLQGTGLFGAFGAPPGGISARPDVRSLPR